MADLNEYSRPNMKHSEIWRRFYIGSSTPDLPAFGKTPDPNHNPFIFDQQDLEQADTENSLGRISTCNSSLRNQVNISASCQSERSNNKKNLAAILYGPRDLRLEYRQMPTIKGHQVLLNVEVCGICGTDVRIYEDGRLGPFTLKDPMVIGHEASGTVMEVGKCVTNLKPGDKVAIEPQVPCRMCRMCKTGNYHMCPNLYFCAAPPNDGNLCQYFTHDADFCHKVPCHLDQEVATLMEPLAVAVHACKKGRITSGDDVLILGSGAIGLATMLAAKAYGASSVFVLDIDDYKLRKAIDLGADCVINTKNLDEEETVRKICQLVGHAPNKTIECCGLEAAIRIGILATKPCGTVVMVGLGADNQCLPVMNSVYKEINIIGSMRYANDYETAIDMVSRGKVDIKPIITHRFKLEDACDAFEFASKKEEQIKVLIHVNPDWIPDESAKC
ncbi:hypothetical protein ABEB36_010053 [Hypothenemus hampei]|uniref:Sorbitol dehydrogenase n=1 Tax=Hypothenemus hampei TaxID=57062 RepID=A0ABD1ELB8_HYPHA